MRNTPGNPVRGEDFWDRKDLIEKIWKSLERGSILLIAPRRFGKTSLMLKIHDESKKGWRPIFVDVEGMSAPEEFIVDLLERVAEKQGKSLLEKVRDFLGKIEEVGVENIRIKLRESLKTEWKKKGKDLFRKVLERDIRYIMLIDELPLMLRKFPQKKIAGEFLHWLRSIRQEPEICEKVRWVFGSSIGFHSIIRELGVTSNVINDLQPIPVLELSTKEAERMVREILKEELNIKRIKKEVMNHIFKKIGYPVPFFLQILLCSLITLYKQEGRLTSEIIDKAYTDLLKPWNRSYFEHFRERLEKYYEPQLAEIVKRMLSLIAYKGETSKQELSNFFVGQYQQGAIHLFDLVISDLENDFYISKDKDVYQFTSNVLRDWWIRYYGWRE